MRSCRPEKKEHKVLLPKIYFFLERDKAAIIKTVPGVKKKEEEEDFMTTYEDILCQSIFR